jgi:ring-1,2-phenylacetyl-CoA epoxidase subunit PaaD
MPIKYIDPVLLPILESVCDPEIPVLSILDMGIVHIASVENGNVHIVITPTYTGCPAMDMITVNLKAAFQEHGFEDIKVDNVLSPTWTTDDMTEVGKEKLRKYGIAPPVEKTSDKSYLLGEHRDVPCPLCNSQNTELVSLFGSTACKAMYKCLDCKEPFDYFKCH